VANEFMGGCDLDNGNRYDAGPCVCRGGKKETWTMKVIKDAIRVAGYNFRTWRKNPRMWMTFALALILCFLLSDKAMRFSVEYDTVMQCMEPFVWTFGDANSILLSSLLLVLLFSDLPFLTAMTPYYLVRTRRSAWILGQIVYICAATGIYLLVVLFSTCILCSSRCYPGNLWSETAAILGYSGAGKDVALPTLVKTLEMSTPYRCTAAIFFLMLLYSLLLTGLMLLLTLKGGTAAGLGGVFGLSLYGFLLNPQTIKELLNLEEREMYKANVAVGWLSPLNHASYAMHNFGYDLLPRLWHTYAILGTLILLLFGLSLRAVRRYNFHFRGSEG